MSLTINARETCRDIPECMMAEDIRCMTLEDDRRCGPSANVIHRWPATRGEIVKEVQPYWSFRDESVAIDRIAMKVEE